MQLKMFYSTRNSRVIGYFLVILLFDLKCINADTNTGANAIQNQLNKKRSSRHSEKYDETNRPTKLVGGFLLGEVAELNLTDPLDRKLSDIIGRNGPDMRPSRDYKDFKDISLNVSMRAWSLMHKHFRSVISEQIQLAQPVIDELFSSSKVSKKCHSAINATFEASKAMKSWAIKMLNSWGQFPMSGIFEGTYGDVGSYHTCVNIENIRQIGHAHYCSLTFRPVLPSNKEYELVVRKVPEDLREMFNQKQSSESNTTKTDKGEAKSATTDTSSSSLIERLTSRDAFTDILEHAQYHHYVYYKLGSCWPIACNPFDIRRIIKSVARRNLLLHGPVKCYSKFKDDYEEEYDDDLQDLKREEDKEQKTAVELVTNSSLQEANATIGKTKRKLVISIWDKNDGIFIWKPHFNKPHWIALSIVIVVSLFIATMTSIDVIFNRIPPLIKVLQLSIKGLPLRNANYEGSSDSDDSSSEDENGARQDQPQRATTLTFECQEAPVASRTIITATSCTGAPKLKTSKRHKSSKRIQVVEPKPFFWSLVDDCSVVTNAKQFFRVSEGQMRNDILCLNGVRCITMIWIILTHTMMYNDWSQWARTRHVEVAVSSLMAQPFFNGSYLVDNFFLMSGLLSAFTAFKHSQGLRAKFNWFAYIFGRWLRLTPQIFFVSMMFIAFPALSQGPHWFPIVGEFSENCQKNWWINVLHLQSFYKKEEMCNFVTWWISIDFFYHYFAVIVILITMITGHMFGFLSMSAIVLGGIAIQCYRHYSLAMPPGILSTIPQTGSMWTTMTLDFFWTPYTHVVPFFFGFYIGYLMALKKKMIMRQLNTRRALVGWTLSISLLYLQSYSTYWWVIGAAGYSRLTATIFYTLCQIVWAASMCWIIIACRHNYGGCVNRFLSCKIFIILGKASYVVYLSHFQVLFLNFGNQSLLLEPSILVMLFLIIGNIFLSTLLGVFLCVVFELPWLKAHRRLMKYV